MFKIWSLRLGVLIKKGIIRLYPLAVSGRARVNWRKVGTVSGALFLYPALTLLLAVMGARGVAKFMVSPFDPVDKSNIWFFFLVVAVSLMLPAVSAFMYWLPRFLTSRLAIPFFKALVVTLALSPFIFLLFAFSEYIIFATLIVLWFLGGAGYEEPFDPDKGRNPFLDPLHSQYLYHCEDPI